LSVKYVQEAIAAAHFFQNDAVVKPALKPMSMRMDTMKAKAFMTRDYHDEMHLRSALTRAWDISETWVVQPRLDVPPNGETVVWAVRDIYGNTFCMAAEEIWKHPRHGGTGCWVRSVDEPGGMLFDKAKRILQNLDFVGLCELPFLIDHQTSWRLLELNPRPWLQVGLPWQAGVPLASCAARVLGGVTLPVLPLPRSAEWINVERLFLAAISGEYGNRLLAVGKALKAVTGATTIAVYGSSFRGVIHRWLRRMFVAGCSTIRRKLSKA
jgi:predicted ATP-grasp superfamily ATP-dependent carboligase